VGAWNFVVAGLLAVTLLPLGQRAIAGATFALQGLEMLLLAGVLAVGVINYLPTRLGPAALLVGLASGLQLWALSVSDRPPEKWEALSRMLLGAGPWLGYAAFRRYPAASLFDRTWLQFRDRFGLLWGQRVRDQFNRSAAHAGAHVYLSWRGLRRQAAAMRPQAEEMSLLEIFDSLTKRFGKASA
jgi:hypothetical protein